MHSKSGWLRSYEFTNLENNKGKKLVAVDPVGAREGNWVFTASGSAARFACPNPEVQTDLTIGGIIDYWESD